MKNLSVKLPYLHIKEKHLDLDETYHITTSQYTYTFFFEGWVK